MKVILLVGLPGSGKTTLGDMIRDLTGGARVNADMIRSTISVDLKFTIEDRRVQAFRMGAISAIAVQRPPALSIYPEEFLERLNKTVVTDFVCPTPDMHKEFTWSVKMVDRRVHVITVWMNTITAEQSRFPDTAALYQKPSPEQIQYSVQGFKTKEQLQEVAADIVKTFNL